MPDYVIVGAGSAGCVLAARLSEDPDVSVLLVEAGPPDTLDNIHIPLGVSGLARTAVDWDLWTGHEPGLDGRRVYLPRGKTLGGSSATNAMVYIRGNPADYDGWNLSGWSFPDLFPYFLRAEDNERGGSDWHGEGGPLAVSDPRHPNPMMDALVDSMEAAGFPRNDDFNGPAQDGTGYYQVTQLAGRRCSTAVAYLHPNITRPNLAVETGVHVERVTFDGLRATGVEGVRLGERMSFRAEREVIVCGGAYNSPQLLMLSGIGPVENMASRLIPPLVDQPSVGKNLQDHVNLWLIWSSREPVSLADALSPEKAEANVGEFELHGNGPLTSNLAEAGGFGRSDPSLDAPDLQFHGIPGMLKEDPPVGFADHGMSIGVCLLTPESRGEVYLAGSEPTAKPWIFHRYFDAAADMERMEAGVARVMEIAGQAPLAPYCSEPHQVPGDDPRAFIRRHAQTLYHPVGTCAIGTGDDAVVDLELRVRGVEALRVVDASVMPVVPRGNTNAPVIALAERAADLIKGTVPQPGDGAAVGLSGPG